MKDRDQPHAQTGSQRHKSIALVEICRVTSTQLLASANRNKIHHPCRCSPHPHRHTLCFLNPQWGAADAEVKVPSGEDTELKRSPFQAWSRSEYSYTCYAYCQGFLPCLFLHFKSIHLHFFQNLSRIFSCVSCGQHMVPV